MKLFYKILILFILFINNSFSQEWVKTEITEFASIKFPDESEYIESQNEIIFTFQDENANYIVSVRKLSEQQTLGITEAEIPNLYKGIVNGTIDSSNGNLISMNQIEIQNIPAIEFEYELESNNNLLNKRFKRIIYVKQNIISISFWPLNNQDENIEENKSKFFKSLILNLEKIGKASNKAIISEENIKNSEYENGFIIGKIVFYLFLFAIIIGVVFFIRKNRKRKTDRSESLVSKENKPLTIICQNCEEINNSNSKYCKSCGYEIKK